MRIRLAVLLVLGALAFANALDAPLMFDDATAIVGNAQIRQVWPLSVSLAPPRETPVAGRPLVNLSFALDYARSGLNPRGYRLGSLAVHLLAALTLFGIVRRTLTRPPLAQRFAPEATNLAWACALIWTVHPLQTEVVNYPSARSESMMGLFLLLTLYCGIRSVDGVRARGWSMGAVAACLAGTFCKESMAVAPLLVALYDRIFVYDSWREALGRRRWLYLGLAASWIAVAAVMLSQPRTTVGFDAGTSPTVYFLNQWQLIVRYLRLAVWPYHGQVLDYGLPRPLAFADVWMQGALLVALGGAAIAAAIVRPRIGFLAVAFFITLAPASSIVPIATEVGAERRMYLPLAALVVLMVIGVFVLTARAVAGEPAAARPRKRHQPAPAAAPVARASRRAAIALLVVVALAVAGSVARSAEYQSTLTMARTIVERWPNGRGFFWLGHELVTAGDESGAIVAFERSAADYPPAHYALGTELAGLGRWSDAERHLRVFLQSAPPGGAATPEARELLGRALYAQGRTGDALRELERVLADNPAHARVHALVGDILLQQERAAEAIPHYEAASRGDRVNLDLAGRHALALSSVGRFDEAVAILQRASNAAPANARLHDMLARTLATAGRYGEAASHFERVTQLDPSNAEARANLAKAQLAARERPDVVTPR